MIFKIYALIIKLTYFIILLINSVPGLTLLLIIFINLLFFKVVRDHFIKNYIRIIFSILILIFSNIQLINALSSKTETQIFISVCAVVIGIGGICVYTYYKYNYVRLNLSLIHTGLDMKLLFRNINHRTAHDCWMHLITMQNSKPGLRVFTRMQQRGFINSMAACIAAIGICTSDLYGNNIPAFIHTTDLIIYVWQADLCSGGFLVLVDFIRTVSDTYLHTPLNPAQNLDQLYDQFVLVNNEMQDMFKCIIEKYEEVDDYGIMWDKFKNPQERISDAYDILIDR
jgi:hypothetical protein